MAVFGRLRMPSLGGATGWLNSEPLGPAELQKPRGAPSSSISGSLAFMDATGLDCLYDAKLQADAAGTGI
jgi:hypothetical protein